MLPIIRSFKSWIPNANSIKYQKDGSKANANCKSRVKFHLMINIFRQSFPTNIVKQLDPTNIVKELHPTNIIQQLSSVDSAGENNIWPNFEQNEISANSSGSAKEVKSAAKL